jgi:hypothetical protein
MSGDTQSGDCIPSLFDRSNLGPAALAAKSKAPPVSAADKCWRQSSIDQDRSAGSPQVASN